MSNIKILTDSVSDIPKVWREQYDIDYIYCNIIWDDKELHADVDWEEYSPEQFYNAMRGGTRITTSTSPIEIEEKFKKYLDEGKDIVYIACSSALSVISQVASKLADKMMGEYPGRTVRVVDTKMAVGGLALLAVEAAKYASNGKTADEVAEHMKAVSPCMQQWAMLDTLTYMKRAGRVKALTAFFGNLFGIKPIVISDANGMNYALKKVKGKTTALDTCINDLKENICYDGNPFPVSEQTIYIGHSDCIKDAEYCAEKIKEIIKPKDVFINNIGPIVGATTGPGMVALFGFGKEVTVNG